MAPASDVYAANETTAVMTEDTSEDTVVKEESSAFDSSEEEKDLSLEEKNQNSSESVAEESNDGAGDNKTEESQTPDGEEVEDTEMQAEPEELKENSFRFQNGELITQKRTARSATYPYAWEKVNGKYMNSLGQVIEGATKKGIDVSHHQGKIDWQKVKNDGIDFAIIRCGYGGDYTSYDDRQWLYNVSECERLGIPYGVYLYSYSKNVEDAKSEAAHVLRLLKGYNPVYGVYYDLEDEPTTGKLDNTTIGTIAKTFCDRISAAGYKVGIYANKYWWTTKLTSSVFQNEKWSKWVAQYNATCTYEGKYDLWQCTSEGQVNGINGNVDLNFLMGSSSNEGSADNSDKTLISASAHVQTYGWMNAVGNGGQIGTTGQSKRLEALKIRIGSGYGDLGIRYSSHVSGTGWQGYVSNGNVSGTTGMSKAIEAVKIELTGTQKSKYDIYYRAHVQNYGWLGWAKNGEVSGTTGYSKRMEALQIIVVPKGSEAPGSTSNSYKIKNESAGVGYEVHMQNYGWQSEVSNGSTGGVVGESKRLEALRIRLLNTPYSGDVEYRTHVQQIGWQNWVKNGATAGTTGKSLRTEAIQIKLTGQMAQNYDIYYRVHVQNYGWLAWTKNGGNAGTEGKSLRMEGLQIRIVKKGQSGPSTSGTAFIKK